MSVRAKYSHTNLIAADWQALAAFYQQVFGCEIVPPERDIQGEPLEKGTGLPQAHLRGAHIRLPGYGDSGPTLEIYRYEQLAEAGTRAVNRPGYGHIAFQVEDVSAARDLVLAHGGSAIGEVVTTPVGTDRSISWCYVTDPEGNAIELQAWNP